MIFDFELASDEELHLNYEPYYEICKLILNLQCKYIKDLNILDIFQQI